jgi:5-dehydro-2-deoxygluconokinase
VLEAISASDPHCNGVLLLGLDAPEDELRRAFERAAPVPMCRGFAVGRSIFGAAAREWLSGAIDDEDVIADVARRYARLIDLWRGMRT